MSEEKVSTPVGIELNITPETINNLVAKALVKSALGEKVLEQAKKAVEQAFSTNHGFGHNNVVVNSINMIVQEQVREELRKEFLPTVAERVKTRITEELIEAATERAMADLRSKLGLY